MKPPPPPDPDTFFKRLGESRRYAFADSDCIMAECWEPDALRQKDGSIKWGCKHRAAKGCPYDIVYIEALKDRRRAQHWRLCD